MSENQTIVLEDLNVSGMVKTHIPLVTAIIIDPLANNNRAHRFYERQGFQFVEARRFGDDDCYVYRLQKPLA